MRPGTIHGIVGENGAGKSTLMGILYGYYRPDRGEILVRGRPAAIRSPQDALAAGIGMVHQHFMLVEPFTVLENVVLGVEGGFRLQAGLARARAALEKLGREYHLEVPLDARVGDLGVGQRQRVEILKALYRGADVLILDEPTAVLTPQEADHLFRILRALREQGKTVVLITHKLREIRDVTDVVTVMRQGQVVATLPTAGTTAEQLAELMVGRKVVLRVDKAPARPGEPVLEVTDLVVEDGLGVERVKGVSLAVRRGEIVGVAGVAGNGQSELLEALAGIRPVKSGRIRWRERDVTDERARSPRRLRRLGLCHVPEDRQRMGLVIPFTARESAILGFHDEATYNGRRPAPPRRGRVELPAPGGGVRRPAGGRQPAHLRVLGRQPAEDRAGPRAGPQPRPPPGRPAHPRRGHRRDRVHPPPPGGAPRRRQGDPAGLGRAGRDPGPGRPHPGHARRAHRRRGGAGAGDRAGHRPDDGGRAPGERERPGG